MHYSFQRAVKKINMFPPFIIFKYSEYNLDVNPGNSILNIGWYNTIWSLLVFN
jgi:hypothetical protein